MLNKKMIVHLLFAGLIALGCTSYANAAVDGPYLGIQAGWGATHTDTLKHPFLGGIATNNTGFAGRAFMGYQFCTHWAAEFGYTRFGDATISGMENSLALVGNTAVIVPRPFNDNIQEDAFDLVGKGILPLGNCFSLYGKLGAAYLRRGWSDFGSDEKLFPAFGVGLNYDITPNVPISVGWNRIQSVGNTDLQSADLLFLGIAYNFGY